MTPDVIEVDGVGRLAIVADESGAALLGNAARGRVWTNRELELLRGWPPEDARKVAECKAMFGGVLHPGSGRGAGVTVPDGPLFAPTTPSAKTKRYQERGHGPVPGSAYAASRRG